MYDTTAVHDTTAARQDCVDSVHGPCEWALYLACRNGPEHNRLRAFAVCTHSRCTESLQLCTPFDATVPGRDFDRGCASEGTAQHELMAESSERFGACKHLVVASKSFLL